MADMDTNILGLLISFPVMGLVIAIGILLKRYASISSEAMRKFVHIGVSNWWFIEVIFFTKVEFAVVAPIFFIVVNSMFTFLNWGKAIGLDDRKRNYGLIYFPITLLIFVLLQYQGMLSNLATTLGMLVMGYGDGLAALFGSKWGKRKVIFTAGGKSVVGTTVMFAVSFIICLIGLGFYSTLGGGQVLLYSLLLGIAAAIIEAVTPHGLDNVTVPVLIALLVEALV